MDVNPHFKRLVLYILLYSIAALVGAYILHFAKGNLLIDVIGVILAVIPVGAFALLMIRSLKKTAISLDELQRRMQVEAMAFGFSWSCSFTLSVGILGILYGLQLNGFIYFCANLAGWAVGSVLVKRIYA